MYPATALMSWVFTNYEKVLEVRPPKAGAPLAQIYELRILILKGEIGAIVLMNIFMDQPQSVLPVQNKKPDIPPAPRSLWWLAVMVVVALALGVWSWMSKSETNTNVNAPATNVNAVANTNTATSYLYPGQDGKNALELLKLAYPNTTTKSSGSLGEQVMAINGMQAGTNQYWQFLVNGTAADVGAGTYITKSTDMIEWKLTSF